MLIASSTIYNICFSNFQRGSGTLSGLSVSVLCRTVVGAVPDPLCIPVGNLAIFQFRQSQ